ncbi:MAG: alginate lyase family protein [Streptosporangiaceae bacterium]
MKKRPLAGLVLASTLTASLVAVPGAGSAEAKPKPFAHPGVVVSKKQLDYVKKNIKKQPYKAAYAAMRRSPLASLKRRPHAVKVVHCIGYGGPGDNIDCGIERDDAMAAYTNALIWYISRDKRRLTLAGIYLNAWSRTLKSHTGADTLLQEAWAGTTWARAAELVKHSMPKGKKWNQQKRFATMLRTKYLPYLIKGKQEGVNGNWDLVMADAAIGISVFLDDRKSFDKSVRLLRSRVPAYFYLKSDGPKPRPPVDGVMPDIDTYWFQPPGGAPAVYADGMEQETCRDRVHPSYSLAATMHVIATAQIQRVNLASEFQRRITAAMEFQSKYSLSPVPAWLCGGKLNDVMQPALEIAYATYHKKAKLPWTRKKMLKQRPAGASVFMAWETLTSGVR